MEKEQLRSRKTVGATGPTIWAIGGGKGGIGKSFISANLAICLARMGKDVTLIDLDLGSANLHTCLGSRIPNQTISDFLVSKVNHLQDLATPTEVQGLYLISGFNDNLNVADLNRPDRQRLIAAIKNLPTSYVILDLGAGTGETTLEFFLAADKRVVAVTPEPTSIENAYRFMKSSFYRQLREIEGELGIQQLIESAMDSRNQLGIRSPADLLRYLMVSNPQAGARLSDRIQNFRVHILINQVRTRQDIDIGSSMKSVCKRYFGIEADLAGYIDHDNAVWQSLRKRRPLILEFPYSSLVGQFLRLTKVLADTIEDSSITAA